MPYCRFCRPLQALCDSNHRYRTESGLTFRFETSSRTGMQVINDREDTPYMKEGTQCWFEESRKSLALAHEKRRRTDACCGGNSLPR